MFNNQFPSGFQSMGQDPYNQVNGWGQVSPYAPSPFTQNSPSLGGMSNSSSIGNMDMMQPSYQPMAGDDTSSQLYPMENPDGISSYGTSGQQPAAFAKGGRVKRSMPSIGQMMDKADEVRRRGRKGDTILAHINPEEASLLKQMGGSGTINPHTGLPEFFFKGVQNFFKNPGKTISKTFANPKRTLGDAVSTAGILLGGPVGGAIGGGLRSVIRGEGESPFAGALRGGLYGAAAAPIANLAGAGLSSLGAQGVGGALSKYGAANAGWTGSIGNAIGGGGAVTPWWTSAGNALGLGGSQAGGSIGNMAAGAPGYVTSPGVSSAPMASIGGIGQTTGQVAAQAAEKGFMAKLLDDPKNVLAMASLAGQYMTKEKPKKEKTAKELGEDMKAMQLAAMLNPEEIARKETHDTELAKAARRTKRNSYLDEEKLGDLKMVYPKQLSPEEAARKGMMIEYYDSPDFHGEPIRFKEGGAVPKGVFFEEAMFEPKTSVGSFLKGTTKGQSDQIRKPLEEGSYVIDASTLSDLGDGNSAAGNKEVDALVSDGEKILTRAEVTKIGKGNHEKGVGSLDKMVKGVRKHKRGGQTKLPPKAKPIEKYMR